METTIPLEVLDTAARMLSAFAPGITADGLKEMLSAGRSENESIFTRKELTRKEAAERLGVSYRTVDRFLESGKLKSCKVGRGVRIPISSINALLNTERAGA